MSDQSFSPDDFVYVDPEARKAVGLVEWDKSGAAIPKEWPYKDEEPVVEEEEANQKGKKPRKRRKKKVRYYPWGSYRTMSKLYKLEGKVKDRDTEDYIPLEKAISNLQADPFWD